MTLPKTVNLPPQYLRSFAVAANQVVLNKLSKPVPYGVSVPVTFSFKGAGSITLQVPIQIPPTRDSNRSTINIQPPELTPLWVTGEHAESGESGSTSVSTPASTSASASAAVTTAATSG